MATQFIELYRRYLALLLVATPLLMLLLVATAGCRGESDWTTFRGERGSGNATTTLRPPLGLLWKLRLQEPDESAKSFNPPVIKGDTIFFGSADGNFYALDAISGYMRWIFQSRGAVNSVPYVDEERVYFGSNDGYVYALDIETGEQIWNFDTGNTVQSLVLRYGDYVIFTSDTGATFFLDPEGNERFRIPNPVWSHHTFQAYDGKLYWAPHGRQFGAFDIERREFLWTVDVTVPYSVWYSFSAVDEERIYYASNFFTGGPTILRYYAMDRESGEMLWEYEDSFDPGTRMELNFDNLFMRHVYQLDYMAPALWKELVIYTSGDTIVRAFDRSSGRVAWQRQFNYPSSSAPVVAGNTIYFGLRGDEGDFWHGQGQAPRLMALDARNGRTLWEMEIEGAILSAPVIAGKRMLFGTDRNLFYLLEQLF